jgi:hypothetical protein
MNTNSVADTGDVHVQFAENSVRENRGCATLCQQQQ